MEAIEIIQPKVFTVRYSLDFLQPLEIRHLNDSLMGFNKLYQIESHPITHRKEPLELNIIKVREGSGEFDLAVTTASLIKTYGVSSFASFGGYKILKPIARELIMPSCKVIGQHLADKVDAFLNKKRGCTLDKEQVKAMRQTVLPQALGKTEDMAMLDAENRHVLVSINKNEGENLYDYCNHLLREEEQSQPFRFKLFHWAVSSRSEGTQKIEKINMPELFGNTPLRVAFDPKGLKASTQIYQKLFKKGFFADGEIIYSNGKPICIKITAIDFDQVIDIE